MRRLFDSLAVRLAVATSLIVVVAVFGVARIYEGAIKSEFLEYVTLDGDAAARREEQAGHAAQRFEAAYAGEGWPGVARELAGPGAPRAAVFGPDGDVRASNLPADADVRLISDGDEARFEMTRKGPDGAGEARVLLGVRPRPLLAGDGTPFGGLVLLPAEGAPPPARAFASSVTAQAGGLVAVMLVTTLAAVFVFTRLALRPVSALTRAAEALRHRRRPDPVAHRAGGELRGLAEALDLAAKEILDREELRRRFVADVAHDLRTPVTNLKGRLEGVRAGLLAPDAKFQDELAAEIEHLERLIDDLQDLAAADAGRLAIHPEELVVREEADAAFAAAFPGGGADFDNRAPGDLRVRADPARVRQIFLNLFDNARRHAAGRLALTVEAAPDGALVRIRVRDNGDGIPDGALDKVFDRFYRADPARGRETGGAGLGLAIVRSLAETHGGAAWAEPSDAGACIGFSLHRAEAS